MTTQFSFDSDILPFLQEDLGSGDITAAIIPATQHAKAELLTREWMVLCGREWFDAVFRHLDAAIVIEWHVLEGEHVAPDTLLCTLHGNARGILSAERTALNLLQTLSATATLSREYANAVAGTRCRVLDTRKTLPGLRLAQKYAVRCGGCFNHRIGLFDGGLIKENHIFAAGAIANAVRIAREQSDAPVEVEVESLRELEEALNAKPDRIMLDNFSLEDLRLAVQRVAGEIELEASGNIDLTTIHVVAQTGVDYISIGALTKNIRAIDLSLRIQL
ncbi:MAG TPA: carboxylating nicotinate-nucleotide diphosphorylase [Methylococcaceae bacterium]|nr:carboxylating nicotinate-nucleotide diphosphorylase [Methylococcaceae bacterium]